MTVGLLLSSASSSCVDLQQLTFANLHRSFQLVTSHHSSLIYE